MSVASGSPIRAEAVVDLAAVRANTALLLARLHSVDPKAGLMAVVKADGYGHGMVPVARAAIDAGAVALGVATLAEAVELAEAGLGVPVVAWLWIPDHNLDPALARGVQLVVSSHGQLAAIRRDRGPRRPAIHLKIDTGLGRGGAVARDFEALARAAAATELAGEVQVVGLMSHLASADVADDPSVPGQVRSYRRALEVAQEAGLRPRWRHLANTPAVLQYPDTVFDLARCGIGIYGVDPVWDQPGSPGAALTPAMTLRARVALVKRVPAGHGVSYGLTYRTARETTLALIPLGYADGIPRAASGLGQVWLRGRRWTIAGRVAMDQFVLDCGDEPVAVGDEVVIFGTGDAGEPTAQEWGTWCGTIGYEIVTRIGPRVPRRYIGTDTSGHREGDR